MGRSAKAACPPTQPPSCQHFSSIHTHRLGFSPHLPNVGQSRERGHQVLPSTPPLPSAPPQPHPSPRLLSSLQMVNFPPGAPAPHQSLFKCQKVPLPNWGFNSQIGNRNHSALNQPDTKCAHGQGKGSDWAQSLASGFFQIGGLVREELEPRGLGFPQADWFLLNIRGKDGSARPKPTS